MESHLAYKEICKENCSIASLTKCESWIKDLFVPKIEDPGKLKREKEGGSEKSLY